MKRQPDLAPGRIPELIREAARYTSGATDEKDPRYLYALTDLHRHLKTVFPWLTDQTRCANCDAKMKKYTKRVNYPVARLMVRLGKHVRDRQRNGAPFASANRNNISQAEYLTHTDKCQATAAHKLGLIAPADAKKTGIEAEWVITTRGFAFLRGEEVPAWVKTWRNEIVERAPDGETTTVKEALKTQRQPKDGEQWTLSDFVEFENTEGRLL